MTLMTDADLVLMRLDRIGLEPSDPAVRLGLATRILHCVRPGQSSLAHFSRTLNRSGI